MGGLRRVPEPMVVDAHGLDGDATHYLCSAVDDLLMCASALPVDLAGARAVDLACGLATLPIRLCRVFEGLHIIGVHPPAAAADIALGQIAAAGLSGRVEILRAAIPWAPLHGRSFDAAISHGWLHHSPDPCDLWREAVRLVRPGGTLLIADLIRPRDTTDLERAVLALARTGAGEPLLLDYAASLQAAYTLDEVAEQLATTGLSHLEPCRVGDRSFAVIGTPERADATTLDQGP